MSLFFRRLISSIILFSGCGYCYDGSFKNITDFPVKANASTFKGIKVDTTDNYISLGNIDQAVDEVEACLKTLYPTGKIPFDIYVKGHCLTSQFDTTFHRECLTVKVAPNWHVGCQGEQVFPCNVNPQLCVDKGITPTAECPCECRSAIQDQDTIVVTPDLLLLKGDLIRMQTTCNYIWIPGLGECYSPVGK